MQFALQELNFNRISIITYLQVCSMLFVLMPCQDLPKSNCHFSLYQIQFGQYYRFYNSFIFFHHKMLLFDLIFLQLKVMLATNKLYLKANLHLILLSILFLLWKIQISRFRLDLRKQVNHFQLRRKILFLMIMKFFVPIYYLLNCINYFHLSQIERLMSSFSPKLHCQPTQNFIGQSLRKLYGGSLKNEGYSALNCFYSQIQICLMLSQNHLVSHLNSQVSMTLATNKAQHKLKQLKILSIYERNCSFNNFTLIIKDRAIIKIKIKNFQLKKEFINLKFHNNYKIRIHFVLIVKNIEIFIYTKIKKGIKKMRNPKLQKLLTEFNNISMNKSELNPNVSQYLKTKAKQLEKMSQHQQSASNKINWKLELMDAYGQLKKNDTVKQKIITINQEMINQFEKIIKTKDLEVQILSNQLTLVKSSLEEQKQENQKIQKQYDKSINEEKQKTRQAIQRLSYKDFQIRELQQKITQYEQQLEQIKSSQYQNMMNTIKQEEIFTSQTQNLYKQNTLLKFQLKEQSLLKLQFSKHIKTLNQEIEFLNTKYQKLQIYLQKKQKRKLCASDISITKDTKRQKQKDTINLIQYKNDFSFKDSIQNDSKVGGYHNAVQSFLDMESACDLFFTQNRSQDSPSRCLYQRDVLNLTDRDRSTHSKNITHHLLRSKKQYAADKQNISQNTLQLNQFENYPTNNNISRFGTKAQINKQNESSCSIDKFEPSPQVFGTQERSLLNKHRRIKSSFIGKSIHEFQQTEQNHFVANSNKLNQGINQQQQQSNNIVDESSIIGYDVNEIVINQELITSKKYPNMAGSGQFISCMQARMINSVKVPCPQQPQPASSADIYYTFFSLTAQCVKLNSKNFNRIISIFFDLEQQYKNVLQKTIPINKWYNYIQDQLSTSLKYAS